jgi:hypothetical protein
MPWTFALRPRGASRFFHAAFLVVWLALWAVAEAAGLVFVFLLLRLALAFLGVSPMPPSTLSTSSLLLAGLFGLVWTALWTWGGVSAMRDLAWTLWGADHLRVGPTGIELVKHAPPLSQKKVFPRDSILRVRLRDLDRALVVETPRGEELLTALGTPARRDELRRRIAATLALDESSALARELSALPEGWDLDLDADSRTLLVQSRRCRRAQTRFLATATAVLALAFAASLHDPFGPGAALLALLTLLSGLGACWLRWGRSEWLVEDGLLVFRRRLGRWLLAEDELPGAQLVVEAGDEFFRLVALKDGRRRAIDSGSGDGRAYVRLGRWIAHRCALSLTLPRGLDDGRRGP